MNVAAPYEVIADFKQFERPLTPTDGNEVLDDLRDVPLLVLNGDTTARVCVCVCVCVCVSVRGRRCVDVYLWRCVHVMKGEFDVNTKYM